MPSVRSVSLGYWIGTGSRGEDTAQAGLSHLIEHLLFKGSSRYASLEIDQIFDGMGAELNAGTGKETTSVYSRVIDEHLDLAFDVMSDMVWKPSFSDVDSEREVILEEIAMYEDDPQDKVFDVLGEAVFGSHPLGRAIIGRSEVVARTPVAQIASFHGERYVPGNVVIAAAGAVDHDALVELAAGYAPSAGATAPAPDPAPQALVPRVRFERKDTEQYHVCLGGPGIARLFQEVRERRGLAYAVYSFTGQYADTGQVGLYVGTRADNLAASLEVVATELDRLGREPATTEELLRAKENLKGRVVLSLESTGARMNRLGSAILTGTPLLSGDEVVEKIDAVSLGDVAELAQELYGARSLSVAGIGADEDAFRGALAPLAAEGVASA
jgi:predicted Zn-dependent peptidase